MPADLVAHLAGFGAALRENGVRVGASDQVDALEAMTRIDLGDRDEVRFALAAAYKIEPRHEELFARLFAEWWEPRPAAQPRPPRRAPQAPLGPRNPGAWKGGAAAALSGEGRTRYSAEESLRKRTFEESSDADLEAMERLMERWARRAAVRPSRRLRPSRARGTPDLRRSFRRAVASGDFGLLARRRRAPDKPRLVVLCDTSGSMDPHARFALSLLLALRAAVGRCEVFAFNTSLVRLTPWLRPRDVTRTLRALQTEVPGWSSGTRIGESLAQFAERHLGSVDRSTLVLVVSDGLDQGDVEPLAGALAAIRARARRIVWLNPLAGDVRYQPIARAMAAAMPYLDRLLPAHDLESLARVVPLLNA